MLRRQHRSGADGATSATPPGLDPALLSKLIGDIYDCALDPSGWSAALATIAQYFSFHSGVLGFVSPIKNLEGINVRYKIDDEWFSKQNDPLYIEDRARLWGGAERVLNYPLDEPIVASHLGTPADWAELGYYRDVLAPRGLIDAVVIALAREPNLVGYCALNRHLSNGAVRARDIDGLRLIAPHLRRAVTIANLFDLKSVEAATFRSVLDAMACAVALVDQNLGIVYANPAAQSDFASGGPVQALRGQLSVQGSVAPDALRASVRVAAEDETQLAQRGIGIPIGTDGGAPMVLHVMPLARREFGFGQSARAVAAVFAVPSARANTPIDAIAAHYDFTPTEAQIFASLARGVSLDSTAAALGVAKSTARTHLLRIFRKTGLKRQAELVALASELSLGF